MTLTEFIEALGRVADKLTNLSDFFPEMPSLNPFNLDKKIESLLMILNKTCLPANMSEQIDREVRKVVKDELGKVKKTKYDIRHKKY